jgi:ribonuclease HI
MIQIFTDGACLGNPGPGGWGAMVQRSDKTCFFSGHETHTTNNRMELLAVIRALAMVQCHEEICLSSDSQYVIKGITDWVHGWEKNNWKNSKKKDVENQDLWKELLGLSRTFSTLSWKWVKGHSQCLGNKVADRLAHNAAHKIIIQT